VREFSLKFEAVMRKGSNTISTPSMETINTPFDVPQDSDMGQAAATIASLKNAPTTREGDDDEDSIDDDGEGEEQDQEFLNPLGLGPRETAEALFPVLVQCPASDGFATGEMANKRSKKTSEEMKLQAHWKGAAERMCKHFDEVCSLPVMCSRSTWTTTTFQQQNWRERKVENKKK
jgi:hypothetical protein